DCTWPSGALHVGRHGNATAIGQSSTHQEGVGGDEECRSSQTHRPGTRGSLGSCPRINPVGRGGRIRTFDLLVPNQALYQAEPRPDVSSLVCCTPVAQARTIEFVSDMQKLRDLPAVHEALKRLAPAPALFPGTLFFSEVRRPREAGRAEILAGNA